MSALCVLGRAPCSTLVWDIPPSGARTSSTKDVAGRANVDVATGSWVWREIRGRSTLDPSAAAGLPGTCAHSTISLAELMGNRLPRRFPAGYAHTQPAVEGNMPRTCSVLV